MKILDAYIKFGDNTSSGSWLCANYNKFHYSPHVSPEKPAAHVQGAESRGVGHVPPFKQAAAVAQFVAALKEAQRSCYLGQ